MVELEGWEIIQTLVPGYTQVDGLEMEWRDIEPRYQEVMKMARDLDRLALQRARARLPLDGVTVHLLYRAYHAAFRAARIKGSVDMKNGRAYDPALE